MRKPPALLTVGGFSYAFMAIIQIVTRKIMVKKSYNVISIAPFQGLDYPPISTCLGIIL